MKDTVEQMIAAHDPAGLNMVLAASHGQVTRAWERPEPSGIRPAGVRHVLMCGMGGSAISGDLAVNFLAGEMEVPFVVNRGYALPSWAGKGTLVIAASYSGNTEETVSSLRDALRRGCHALCITNGGAVGALAEKEGLAVFPLDPGLQPRYALYSSFFTLLRALRWAGLVPDQSAWADKAALLLKKAAASHAGGGGALVLARRLLGKLPVIYSGEGVTESAGLRFKAQLNENGKVHAFHAALPEMNHNEIVGWESAGSSAVAVCIMDRDYHPRVLKRFVILRSLLEKIGVDTPEISSESPDRKIRLLDIVYFCDWVSYYLALLGGRDPGEIEYIDHMKKELSRPE